MQTATILRSKKVLLYITLGLLMFSLIYPSLTSAASYTNLISRNPLNGEISNGYSFPPHVSANGRYIAFATSADNLVAGSPGVHPECFVFDNQTAVMRRVLADLGEFFAPNDASTICVVANDGLVTFHSHASNIGLNDNNGTFDIFTEFNYIGGQYGIATISTSGSQVGNGASYEPDISADGSTIVFTSYATNLTGGPQNGNQHIYKYQSGQMSRVTSALSGSRGQGETLANGNSQDAKVSDDGNSIVFRSNSTNLDPTCPGNGAAYQVYLVSNFAQGDFKCVSKSYEGGANPGVVANEPVNSPDVCVDSLQGKVYVAYQTLASNIGFFPDTNNVRDIYLSTVSFAQGISSTTRISRTQYSDANGDTNGNSYNPSIAQLFPCKAIAYESESSNLVSGDTNANLADIYYSSRDNFYTGTTLESRSTQGAVGNNNSRWPSVTGGGDLVFHSLATNLVSGDTNGLMDAFYRFVDAPRGK